MQNRIGKPMMPGIPMLLLLAVWLSGCTIGGSGSADSGFAPSAQSPALVAVADSVPVPGYEDGSVPWEPGDTTVVPVQVSPAVELRPGDGKMVRSVSGIPWTEPQTGPGHSAGLECSALDFYDAANAGPSEVQGLSFDSSAGSAWACFELKTDPGLPASLGIAWYSLPLDFNRYYVGIGDRSVGNWRWYPGPDDGVLSIDPALVPASGNALVCILLEGGQLADLWKLRWGVNEVRGTGLLAGDDALRSASAWTPGRSTSAALPTKVDLNHYAPWVHNQGSFGSCTAFACNDTAFGIMLARTYGDEGWDSTTTENSTSPLWSYVNSGKPPVASQTFNPLCAGSSGRYMSDAFNVLKIMGTSTEQAAPYTTSTDCSQAFSQTAQSQAELIRIDDWHWINSSGLTLVTAIKEKLAADTPVPMATYGLENALLYYSGGVYEFGGTPGLNGGHAMCVVGYDDSLQAFDIRNQWGSNWGAGGHVWFSYDSVAQMSQLGRFYAYYLDVSYSSQLAEEFLGSSSPVLEDQGEPNNSLATALPLPAFPLEEQFALGADGDELDWYRFSYNAGESTTFSITSNPAQLILSAGLYDAAGQLISESALAGGTQTISGTWSGSGSAWLKLQPSFGSGAYTIAAVSVSAPPAPQGLQASFNEQVGYGLTLSWQASSGADSYSVQRGESSSGPFTEIGSSFSTTYFDFSARDWGSYYYRLQAIGPGGSSSYSSVAKGTVSAPAVTNLVASEGSFADHVSLSWDGLAGAEQYQVYRGPAGGGVMLPLRRVESTQFSDTGARRGVHYSYRVAALQGSVSGPRSNAALGWTSGSALIVQGELRPGDGDDQTVVPADQLDNDADGRVVNDGQRIPIK